MGTFFPCKDTPVGIKGGNIVLGFRGIFVKSEGRQPGIPCGFLWVKVWAPSFPVRARCVHQGWASWKYWVFTKPEKSKGRQPGIPCGFLWVKVWAPSFPVRAICGHQVCASWKYWFSKGLKGLLNQFIGHHVCLLGLWYWLIDWMHWQEQYL